MVLNIPGMAGLQTGAVTVQAIGGPTALIGIGGVRLLTDPTFDPPGDYPLGSRTLTKTAGPAIEAAALGRVDAVLLSHDQHPDNLDRQGRAFLDQVPLVLSTAAARGRLGGAVRALPNWEQVIVPRPDGGELRITGVPAQHGPAGSEPVIGEVTGFVLAGDGLPAIYVSGDNASLAVVQEIVDRLGPMDGALLNAGAAQTPLLDHADLTLDSAGAAEAARILGARWVVPLHVDGWAHYTQGMTSVRAAFTRAELGDRLWMPSGGEIAILP